LGKLFGLFLVLVLMVVGIRLMRTEPEPAPATGLEGYTNQLQRAEDKARDVVGATNVSAAKNAVERFQGEQGRNPESLQEAVDKGYLDKVPQGVAYDPSTGQVTGTP
jgi:hypothetical protein